MIHFQVFPKHKPKEEEVPDLPLPDPLPIDYAARRDDLIGMCFIASLLALVALLFIGAFLKWW